MPKNALQISYGENTITIKSKSLDDLRRKIPARVPSLRNGANEDIPFKLVYRADCTEIDDEAVYRTLTMKDCIRVVLAGQHCILPNELPRKVRNAAVDCQLQAAIDAFRKDPNQWSNLQQQVNILEDRSDRDTRSEDREWFEGNSEKLLTKDQVMRATARRRLWKYLDYARTYVDRNPPEPQSAKETLDIILNEFHNQLKAQEWFSDYFARDSSKTELRICDANGLFRCEGAYNVNDCRARHCINPYQNYGTHLMFQFWSLDHRIEKGSQVLPALIHAVENVPPGYTVNQKYFFELLFTRANLGFVFDVCHDRKPHQGLRCDDSRFYVPE